jgi:hypothetical protein
VTGHASGSPRRGEEDDAVSHEGDVVYCADERRRIAERASARRASFWSLLSLPLLMSRSTDFQLFRSTRKSSASMLDASCGSHKRSFADKVVMTHHGSILRDLG